MRFSLIFFSCLAFISSTVHADILFFINDTSGFEAATSSLEFLGSEDFESSTLGSGEIGRLDDPLQPGVANGALPFGTNPDIGLTLQSNTLAGNATVTSPLGTSGLATYSDGFGSSPTDQLIANFSNHSLDMLFAEDTLAMQFLPIFVDASGVTTDRGDLELEVYDPANNLLGSTIISDVNFFFTDVEVGIVATEGMEIGRINLYDGSIQHWQGVDDVSVFRASSVPEPSSISLLSLMAIGGLSIRRKHCAR